LYGQRSLPQMQARLTVTTASVGSMRRASGTFSMRTFPAPNMTVARIVIYLFLNFANVILCKSEAICTQCLWRACLSAVHMVFNRIRLGFQHRRREEVRRQQS